MTSNTGPIVLSRKAVIVSHFLEDNGHGVDVRLATYILNGQDTSFGKPWNYFQVYSRYEIYIDNKLRSCGDEKYAMHKTRGPDIFRSIATAQRAAAELHSRTLTEAFHYHTEEFPYTVELTAKKS